MIESRMGRTALEILVELLERACLSPHKGKARCPCHDDRTPSLSYAAGKTRPVVVKCHACPAKFAEIIDALRPTPQERAILQGQSANGAGPKQRRQDEPIARYRYLSRDGDHELRKLRFAPKRFERVLFEVNEWRRGLNGIKPGIYQAQEVRAGIARGDVILVAAGEKDADRLVALGFEATTTPHGEGTGWTAPDLDQLAGLKQGVVFEDNDATGRESTEAFAKSMTNRGATVQVVTFRELSEHSDVSDWLDTLSGTDEDKRRELMARCAMAPTYRPSRKTHDQSDAPETPTPGAEPYPALDLDGETDPIEWVPEGWIPYRSITPGCGATGEGKSTLLGAQALSIAAGVPPWRGGKAPLTIRPVVYLDAEMGPNATRRMFRRIRDGLGLAHTPARLIVCSDPGGVSMLTSEGRQRIEATFKAAADRFGAGPVLILDTLSAVLAGLVSFNDAALIEPIYAHLFRWRDNDGVTVELGHHPRKRGRNEGERPTLDMVRDSSTHVGKCSDVLFGQKPMPDAPYLDIYTLKCRGRDPVSVQRIGYQSDGHGQPIVLSLLEAPQPVDDALVLRAQGLIMSFLREIGGTAKRAAIVQRLESLVVKERTVDRALKSLITLGALGRPKQGTYSIRLQATVLDGEEK